MKDRDTDSLVYSSKETHDVIDLRTPEGEEPAVRLHHMEVRADPALLNGDDDDQSEERGFKDGNVNRKKRIRSSRMNTNGPASSNEQESEGCEVWSVTDLISPPNKSRRPTTVHDPISNAPMYNAASTASTVPMVAADRDAKALRDVHARWTVAPVPVPTAAPVLAAHRPTLRHPAVPPPVAMAEASLMQSGLTCDHSGAGPAKVATTKGRHPGRLYIHCMRCGNVVYI